MRTVVRRSMALEAERAAPPRPADGASWEMRAERKPTQTGPRAPDLPIDVNRLTDQVIQAIDRRIIAQRERLGRI